ncbi:MAG: uroporphyrinogen-III decarboxylase [Holophagales bacterium]|nr:uroporphyrinogen-III decarboxylase [Holophagales bacterium]
MTTPTNPGQAYGQRLARMKAAVALEKPDRTPVISWSDAFCANHVGAPMSRFSSDLIYSGEVTARSFELLPGFDAAEMAVAEPDWVAAVFLSKMKIAGRDLPEGTPWMVDEQERIAESDYDVIAERGWFGFFVPWAQQNLGITVPSYIQQSIAARIEGTKRLAAIGVPTYTVAFGGGTPLEALSAGRTMSRFVRDLHRIPDRVQAAMDATHPQMIGVVKQAIRESPVKPFSVFVGLARSSPEFFGPKLWDRFVWPYLKSMVEAIIEEGVVANLHFDSCWDRELPRLREFPKGSCVFACDHATDIRLAKKILGDRMCIKGDVPSAMLSYGTPDEVRAYCKALIADMGDGFILSPACTMPANAKLENVMAMLEAVEA